MSQLNRRHFISAVAVAATTIAGFDPTARSWVTTAEADPRDPIPALDGTLATDDASRDAAAHDEGSIVSRRPRAVLRPGSVDDIAAMIHFCRRHGIPVAARGQGHSPFGQAQVEAGLVIEMASLGTIHSIEGDRADVDAGVRWKDLFQRTVAQGLTPPVLTGFTGLSIGGTLSMAGVGSVNRAGVQVDHVRALQVVTGEGRIVWCSPHMQRDLFEAVLSGQGQFGVITRAVIDLVAAPERARQAVLQYVDPAAFFTDLQMLLDRNEIENIYGLIVPPPPGSEPPPVDSAASVPWVYQINVAKYYTGTQQPDMSALLRGVSDITSIRQDSDTSYADFILRVDTLIDFLKMIGLWDGVPHPWIDVFLPGEAAPTFVPRTMSSLAFDDVGAVGFVLLFPIRRELLTRRNFPMPAGDSEWVFLFDVLTSAPAPGPNTAFVAEKLRRNRRIYEEARAVGGKLYPISAVRMEPGDWLANYGFRYFELARLKHRFDPNRIMTPAPHVFYAT